VTRKMEGAPRGATTSAPALKLGRASTSRYEGQEGASEGMGGEGVEGRSDFARRGRGGGLGFCEEGKRRASGVWERRESGCG
jgi:hypothetical protein